jgi:hypothetical protein
LNWRIQKASLLTPTHLKILVYSDLTQHAIEEVITMIVNVGFVDKIARIVVGVALLALTLTGTIGVWGWVGLVPLVTGLVGYCPLYKLIGVSTYPPDKPQGCR